MIEGGRVRGGWSPPRSRQSADRAGDRSRGGKWGGRLPRTTRRDAAVLLSSRSVKAAWSSMGMSFMGYRSAASEAAIEVGRELHSKTLDKLQVQPDLVAR